MPAARPGNNVQSLIYLGPHHVYLSTPPPPPLRGPSLRVLCHYYPFIPCPPCCGNIEIFSGTRTEYFNCKYTTVNCNYYFAETPRAPPRILGSAPKPCGGKNTTLTKMEQKKNNFF